MDEAAVAALRDLYSDLEIDGRVLDLGGAGIEGAVGALIGMGLVWWLGVRQIRAQGVAAAH
jgi:hypothetical protein